LQVAIPLVIAVSIVIKTMNAGQADRLEAV